MIFKAWRNIILNNVFFKMSIKNRLIIYFVLSVFIPTIIIAAVIYNKSSNIITNKIDQLVEKNLNSAQTSILQKIETADDLSTLISFNTKLMDILALPKPQNPLLIIEEINNLNSILESYNLSNMSNFTKTSMFPKIYLMDRSEYKEYKISDRVFDISEISKEEWYTNFPNAIFKIVGFNKLNTLINTVDSIRVAKKLYSIKPFETQFIGILTIDIETNYFIDILNSIKTSDYSQVFILDNNSVILSSENSDKQNISSRLLLNIALNNDKTFFSEIEKINGLDMLVSVKKIENTNWSIVSISPIKELNKELIAFNKFVYLIIILSVALSFLIAILLASDISNPIQKLVKSMSNVKDGNFEINLSYKRNDEFAFLIIQYKTMVREIKELINKLYISELDKQKVELKSKQYELKALQAQINPHFLYNTLDSVNWLAIKYKADDISIMVKSLSNFFRYSLNKGMTEITLEEEKKQIESYLMIQKMRFREKLDFVVDFSPEILKCKTVKLILQPIVENAIIHGIEKQKGKGFIEILGYRVGEVIEIKISDNGVGADVDKLNKMLIDKLDAESSFGTKNVYDRIKQNFGEAFDLTFYNNKITGVTVVIRLPYDYKALRLE